MDDFMDKQKNELDNWIISELNSLIIQVENYYNDSVGTCDICGSIDTKLKDNICKSCNRALKEFGNNIDTLQKAVLYLERNK